MDNDLESAMKSGDVVAKKLGSAVDNRINKVSQRRKTIKGVKSEGYDPKGSGIRTPDKILKGKKYQLDGMKKKTQGNIDKTRGRLEALQGRSMIARSKMLSKSAEKAAAVPVVGAAAAAKMLTDAAALGELGTNMVNKGHERIAKGNSKIKEGEELSKRGKILEQTGKDIGSKTDALKPARKLKIPSVKALADKIVKKGMVMKIAIIAIAAMLALVLIVVLMVGSEVEEGSNNDGDNGNVPYVITSQVMGKMVIELDSSGNLVFMCTNEDGNLVTIDEALDNALKTLRENNCSAYDDLGSTDDERKAFLKILIQAEIATQYPDISNGTYKNSVRIENGLKTVGDKLSGNVNVSRKDGSGNVTKLTYVNETEFSKLLSERNPDVMNHYTLRKNYSSGTGGMPSTLVGSEAAEQIWNFLVDSGCTEQGAAALMGNLQAESGLVSTRIEGDFSSGYQRSMEYTQQVDSGTITEQSFLGNGTAGHGYGLAQWTYPTRKQGLYSYAKSKGTSIGDLQMQLEYLVTEFQTIPQFKKIWSQITTSTDINSLSDLILIEFENPADISGNTPVRRGNAAAIYSQYSGTRAPGSNSNQNTTNTNQGSNSNNEGSTNNGESNNEEENSNTASQNSNASQNAGESNKINSFDKFLFIGDSRYAGIQNELLALGSNTNVCAVSGSTAKQWLEVAKNGSGVVLGTAITLPATDQVSNISIMLGVNDLSQEADLKQLLQSLHARYPNAMIIYNSIYHVAQSYRYNDPATMNTKIDGFNQTIKTYCESENWTTYVDVTNGLNDDNGFLKNADFEGLHLVDQGKGTLVLNIKSTILGGVSGGSSSGSKSSSTYGIVVANLTTRSVYTVDSYDEYLYSRVVSTSSGTTSSGTRDSTSPQPVVKENSTETIYTSTAIDYQTALNSHTMYFDFLWAVFVETRDKRLVEDLATLAIDSTIDVTVYSEEANNTSVSKTDLGEYIYYVKKEGTSSYEDIYKAVRTTTTTVKTVSSKFAITNANTWLMEYSNNAPTYTEYKSKSYENIREKVKDSDTLMVILRRDTDKLESMRVGAYKIERMLEENEKARFMYSIYEHVLNEASKPEQTRSLKELIDVRTFDLSTFSAVIGLASGEGSLGGEEIAQSGDGYNNIFKVGTRTYINYKQMQGPWQQETLAGFPSTKLGLGGCAINSIAVILSGYGINMTPKDVNDYAKTTATPTSHDITLGTLLGKHVTRHDSGDMSAIVMEQLNSGKPCMIWTDYYLPSRSHFIAILAVSDDGNSIYVSDVGGEYEGAGRDGWQPTDYLSRVKAVYTIDD